MSVWVCTQRQANASAMDLHLLDCQLRASNPPWLLERVNVQVGMGNLRKEDNPLELQYLANEFLGGKNYKNFLKINTDGSMLDDGAVGAAFVVPEFNTTHSFSLPAVSVYTAELVDILMTLKNMNAIHTPPSLIVICCDS